MQEFSLKESESASAPEEHARCSRRDRLGAKWHRSGRVACGIPHLLKGEYAENVGTGGAHTVRQPVGVRAGITPFTSR
jgi:acyl-CoA reductase-like NAD-dependent aldehyde dehydrogenase